MSGLVSEPDAAAVRRLQEWLDAGLVEARLPLLTESEAHAVVELLEQLDILNGDDATTDVVRTLIIRILDRVPR